MSCKPGQGSLLYPMGYYPIEWDDDLLNELLACVRRQMTIAAMCRHIGVSRDGLVRGMAILVLRDVIGVRA